MPQIEEHADRDPPTCLWHGTNAPFYDIMIRFMENFEEIFGAYNYCDE